MDFKKILFKTNTIDVEKSLPDSVIFISKDGKIQWVNDITADFFETSKMHLMTSNISDFIENIITVIENSKNSKNPAIVKLCNKEVYFDMTVREIEDGYVLDLRHTVQNELNKSEDKDLTEVNRHKNVFLTKLSNDFKSPIQSIVGFSQAMADGLGGSMSEQQEKYIRIINKNSSDLMYFIAKLLELSQTESNIKKPDKKPFDLISLINAVIKYNEQLYKGKDIKITVNHDEQFKKTITSDSDIIKNIIQNILEVILKSIDMGDISVSLSNPDSEYLLSKNIKQGDYVLVSLSSNSFILSEGDLECMFDPYKIVDSTNRKNVLRAIVLASVKNLVQSINGTIWVESQILKSTNFNVLIPEMH